MESPVVKNTLAKKTKVQRSRAALYWGLVNFTMILTLYYEIYVANILTLTHPVVRYLEYCLAVVFTINTVVNAVKYLVSLSSGSVELTPRGMKLLGVKDNEVGFRCVPSPVLPVPESDGTIHFTPSSTLSNSPSINRSSPSFTPVSPLSPSNMTSPGYLMMSSSNSHMTPPGYQTGSYSSSQNTSLSRPSSASQTPLSPLDGSGLRSRSRGSPARYNENDTIASMEDLDKYLQEEAEKDYKAHIAHESSPSSGTAYWSWNRTTDYSSVLRKFQYQIACRSPTSDISSRNDDDPDTPSKYSGDEVWSRLSVPRDSVDKWTEYLRKWLSQTIMNRLVTEIHSINETLSKIGCEDMQIGEVSISTLKQVAMTKCQHVPTLNKLTPYLDCHANQEYLVQRLLELGKTGCMSDFNWNGGMTYKDKPWKSHLPTDTQIVMHCFCTYFDSHLPPHPKYPDGKIFTTQHFLKTPDKPNLEKKDNLVLYQSRINPPHYKVILADDIWDLNKGRNNMFHAILLFLHHIKTKECGMLGRVNMGMSGINVLWILEQT